MVRVMLQSARDERHAIRGSGAQHVARSLAPLRSCSFLCRKSGVRVVNLQSLPPEKLLGEECEYYIKGSVFSVDFNLNY